MKSLFLGIFFLVGCATSGMLGAIPTQHEVERWGCDPAQVAEDRAKGRAELFEKYGEDGWHATPQIGWTICKVLARVGYPYIPERIGQIERTQFGNFVTFSYYIPAHGAFDMASHGYVMFTQSGKEPWRVTSLVGF